MVKPEIVLLTWSVRGSNGVHDKKLAIEALSLTIKNKESITAIKVDSCWPCS